MALMCGETASCESFRPPILEAAATRPGITTSDRASITRAPAGIDTFFPTAAIFPSRISTIPFLIGGPLTGSIFPARTATTSAARAVQQTPQIAASANANPNTSQVQCGALASDFSSAGRSAEGRVPSGRYGYFN